MEGAVTPPGQGTVLYDVELRRLPPESLLSRYPSVSVRTTTAQTALRRQVDGPAQMGALLRELASVGLVLTDVHRLAPTQEQAAPALYEIRVAGELGDGLLSYFRCAHYDVPQRSVVRLAVAAAELNQFLQECTDCGATIERVRRVGN